MNTAVLRTIAVAGVLAAIGYILVTSPRKEPGPRTSAPSSEGTAVPNATPSSAPPSQAAPDVPAAPVTPGRVASPSLPISPDAPAGPANPASSSAPDVPAAPRPAMLAPGVTAGVAVPPPPPPAPATDADFAAVETDLEHVRMIIREYRDVVGENPVGTNAEIMKAVMGDNLKQAKIGLPDGQGLNGKGELIDRWGTPYFFHQVSKSQMEVRSAGPDRVMWTDDDREL